VVNCRSTAFKIPGYKQGQAGRDQRNQQECSSDQNQLGAKFLESKGYGSGHRLPQIE
jgi:hypothetical protein